MNLNGVPTVLRFINPSLFFFFQAEDGIRDYKVTGVQTCALPISPSNGAEPGTLQPEKPARCRPGGATDRKSTRLNSSHLVISYAVFCLKKKKINKMKTKRKCNDK